MDFVTSVRVDRERIAMRTNTKRSLNDVTVRAYFRLKQQSLSLALNGTHNAENAQTLEAPARSRL
jgi:hypothetical protein